MKASKSKIPTIIGVLILVVGIAVGVFFLQQRQLFRLSANPDLTPKGVKITNITSSSFTVSWTTDKPTTGFVKWGPTNQIKNTSPESSSSPGNTHSINVTGLNPSSTYQFEIHSNKNRYDNDNIPWQIQTGPPLNPPETTTIISGKVLLPNGAPAPDIIVYVSSSDFSSVSTLTSKNGEWVLPLTEVRSTDLSSHPTLTDDTLIDIYVEGGPLGIATAQVLLQSSNPTPPITLGRVHDFRNEIPTDTDSRPRASLTLPESEEATATTPPNSKFELPDPSSIDQISNKVTIDSIKDGETIFTDEPEFFGQGPSDTVITVTVESDNTLTDQISVDTDGSWQWSVPDNLSEGEHTITIKWTNADGIIETLTRKFIVKAADNEPAFESTPSQTIKPTSTPTSSPTAKPTSTPTATPTAAPAKTASPSATPRVSIPSTESAVPEPGTPLPTLILFITGLALLLSGAAFTYLHEENQ